MGGGYDFEREGEGEGELWGLGIYVVLIYVLIDCSLTYFSWLTVIYDHDGVFRTGGSEGYSFFLFLFLGVWLGNLKS